MEIEEKNRNRIVFHPNVRLGYMNAKRILCTDIESDVSDINDVLELYNLKKYIDNDAISEGWTKDEFSIIKQKTNKYGTIVSKYITSITAEDFEPLYNTIIFNYKNSFWELVNNYGIYKKIPLETFHSILDNNPRIISTILHNKRIVDHYNIAIRKYLLSHPESAEIILSFYERKNDKKYEFHLPKNLTIEDKQDIIANYLLDEDYAKFSYLMIIQNAKNIEGFKISDKIRLKAQRLYEGKKKKLFLETGGIKFGISIRFLEQMDKTKVEEISDGHTITYSYSIDYIKQNNNPYALFENFIYLFEYLDNQHRIKLVSKDSNSMFFERHFCYHSLNDYNTNFKFRLLEKTSFMQILEYSKVLEQMDVSLENILSLIFTRVFPEKYGFANNCQLLVPTAIPFFERVRILAPEFESVLKQYKLFVEEGSIDFDLLQISSKPISIKDIPSLNQNKYFYFNSENTDWAKYIDLFFSDETTLNEVDQFEGNHYMSLFELLANENVKYDCFDEDKDKIDYLIERNHIYIDQLGYIRFTNQIRLCVLYDLYKNEVASFYRYPVLFQQEVMRMAAENIVRFEGTLFSKPEQYYFNYILNKSEFTNGLDLRNNYMHGTQANPENIEAHKCAYYTYLKLIVLVLLKIDDDLSIKIKQQN